MSESYPLTVAALRQEANHTLVVELDVPESLRQTFAFLPGQYLTFVEPIEGEEVRRSYSICSARDEPLSVAIKHIEGGKFSNFAHQRVAVGQVLNVLPPAGGFCIEPGQTAGQKYLCIAAGSGITPIISIIKSLLTTDPARRDHPAIW